MCFFLEQVMHSLSSMAHPIQASQQNPENSQVPLGQPSWEALRAGFLRVFFLPGKLGNPSSQGWVKLLPLGPQETV